MIENNTVTIVGSSGFLGKSISTFFKKKNYKVREINKNDFIDLTKNYGTIFYCAGVTVDFQKRVFDTIEAHVMYLKVWLENVQFDRFVYISSARIYIGQEDASEDRDLFSINKNDIYNQTKIMGELACLSTKLPIVILRISNVIGYSENSPYFLWNVFRQAKQNQKIQIQESMNSVRDYLYLNDLLSIFHKITQNFLTGIYNVAASINISHAILESIINKRYLCEWEYGLKTISHPIINNDKIKKGLSFQFSNPYDVIDNLFKQYITGTHNDEK